MTYDKHDTKALDDLSYPAVDVVGATCEQLTALFRKWKRDDNGKTWSEFAHSATPTIGCEGALVVNWCNMWLVIETDGYTHS